MVEKFVMAVGYAVCAVGSVAAAAFVVYWLVDSIARHLGVIRAFYWFVRERTYRLQAMERAKQQAANKPEDR